ncbi:hypothetical protein ABID23_001049, partial [Bartonella silvatica]
TLQVVFGYEGSISAFMGCFVVESVVSCGGSDGEILRLCGKSASIRKELKEQDSEHFDHKTVGEIVETLAKRHCYQAKISPQFTQQTLPYVVRTDQSAVDFLTRLADRMQARFLIKDNKFLFISGDNLPALELHKSDCSSWEFTLEPRTQYGSVEAFYFDPPYWDMEDYYGKDLFKREDYQTMSTLLAQLKRKFLLSLNDVPEIRKIFSQFKIKEVNTSYTCSSNNPTPAQEVIISNCDF